MIDDLDATKQARQDEEKKLAEAIELNKKCQEKVQSTEEQSKSAEDVRLSELMLAKAEFEK